MPKDSSNIARIRRHARVRKKVVGTALRPRLSVFRSLKHIYAQITDDSAGHTLAAASTLAPNIRNKEKDETKIAAAHLVGSLIAKQALQKKIDQVVFDRSGYKYHGRVKALAEACREAGLRL